MNNIFNNSEILLNILDKSGSLRYITSDMKSLKCTSRMNYNNINNTLKLYLHNYNKSMYKVFGNKYLLLNIFDYMYEKTYSETKTLIKKNIFTPFNKSSVKFKNSSKIFNILSRKAFCYIININKDIFKSKDWYLNYSSTEIILDYYLDEYIEIKKYPKFILYDLCKYCLFNIVENNSSYCKIHQSFYVKNRGDGYTYYRTCEVCNDNLIKSNSDKYNKYTYCSTKCSMKAKRNRKLKMPPDFMVEPILSIDDINKYFSNMKI